MENLFASIWQAFASVARMKTQMEYFVVKDEQDLCDDLVVWAHRDFSDPADKRGVQRLSVPLDAQTEFSKSTVLKLQLRIPAHSNITGFLFFFLNLEFWL